MRTRTGKRWRQFPKYLQRFDSKIQLAQVDVESDSYLQFAFGSQQLFIRHHSKPFVRFDFDPLHVFPSGVLWRPPALPPVRIRYPFGGTSTLQSWFWTLPKCAWTKYWFSNAIAPFLLQLTSENFWYLMDKYRYLGIVFSAQIAQQKLVGVNAAVQFVLCDYDLFASQFQANSTNSLVLSNKTKSTKSGRRFLVSNTTSSTTEQFSSAICRHRIPVIVTGLPPTTVLKTGCCVSGWLQPNSSGANEPWTGNLVAINGMSQVYARKWLCGAQIPGGGLYSACQFRISTPMATVSVGKPTGEWCISPMSTAFASMLMDSGEAGVKWQVLGYLNDAILSETGKEILRPPFRCQDQVQRHSTCQ
ncbi:hypothetical protein BASA82_000490 [Batrachochytrium salamandrivorans]|nr:hypothetical protein BASA82_000490 [Batrachochytrium salamandrivorans]